MILFCNSNAALDEINKGHLKLTRNIQHQLKEMDKLVKVCRMPTYIGIPRNDTPDQHFNKVKNVNVKNNSQTTLDVANAIAKSMQVEVFLEILLA